MPNAHWVCYSEIWVDCLDNLGTTVFTDLLNVFKALPQLEELVPLRFLDYLYA
ncbi:hypothetical protein J6590_077714, partial [Homalodisca vitripennis]